MKSNIVTEVKKQIETLINEKQKQLDNIQLKQVEESEKLKDASARIKTATANMDLSEYESAKADKFKSQTALEMYRDKKEMLQNQEYVTEDESNQVINKLLDHESVLEKDFLKAAEKPLEKLSEIVKEYMDAVRDCESVIFEWTNSIRPNYIDPDTARRLPDGTITNRRDHPVPVHKTPYLGCPEVMIIKNFLEVYEKNKR